MNQAGEAEMQVALVMTPEPITIGPDASLDEALQVMDEHGIRHLPVLDGSELVGVVSDRDLLEATSWLPYRFLFVRGGAIPFQAPKRVREVMRLPCMRIEPRDSVVEAARELLHGGSGCLPILDHGELVAIVTEMDLLKACTSDSLDGPTRIRRAPAVADYMTRGPAFIHWHTSLGVAIGLCRTRGVRHLPVLEAERLAGIVSDRDLRRGVGTFGLEGMPVDPFVSTRTVTVGPMATLPEAAEIMSHRKFSSLPVIDDEGGLVGLLTLPIVLDHFLCTCRERVDPSDLK